MSKDYINKWYYDVSNVDKLQVRKKKERVNNIQSEYLIKKSRQTSSTQSQQYTV